MRVAFFIIIAATLASCGRAEPSGVTLEIDKATRVNGCHISLDNALLQDPPVAHLTYACDVPESALKEKNWWGTGSKPPWTAMNVGDCLRLNKKIYCMERIEPGKSATLKATYEEKHWNGDLLERIR